jgi:hypothetical protein
MTPSQFKVTLAREYAEVQEQVRRLNIKIDY